MTIVLVGMISRLLMEDDSMKIKELIKNINCNYEAAEFLLKKCGINNINLEHQLSDEEMQIVQRYLNGWNKVDYAVSRYETEYEQKEAEKNLLKVLEEYDYIKSLQVTCSRD